MSVQITTPTEFEKFLNGDYGYGTASAPLDVQLMNDIDFKDLENPDGSPHEFQYMKVKVNGTNISPYFTFNGNNHTIKNIFYQNPMGTDFYLFGTLSNSSQICVKNLIVKDMFVMAENIYLIESPLTNDNTYIENVKIYGSFYAQNKFFAYRTLSRMSKCHIGGIIRFRAESWLFRTNKGDANSCDISIFGQSGAVFVILGGSNGGIFSRNGMYMIRNIKNALVQFTSETSNFSDGNYFIVLNHDKVKQLKMSDKTVAAIGNFYDKTILDSIGMTITGDGGKGETTAHLKDLDYMRNTYGLDA